MWLVFAFGSAIFAGITSILAKCGIRKTDSTVATAIRTIVVLAFSWLMVFAAGSQNQIGSISGKAALFLILSGLATGASWLCYFKALQLGDVNKVVPIDKSSTVLTILLAFAFLHEAVSLPGGIGVSLIAVGTFLMIEKKEADERNAGGSAWLWYALGSAAFASPSPLPTTELSSLMMDPACRRRHCPSFLMHFTAATRLERIRQVEADWGWRLLPGWWSA